MKRIVIAGGTGHLGIALGRHFTEEGWRVQVLTRRPPRRAMPAVEYVQWDGERQGKWAEILEGAEALINLCGKSVNCRYTAANRRALVSSRVAPTEALGKALQGLARPPALWINASSAAYYGFSENVVLDDGAPAGNDFPASICRRWEEAFFSFNLAATRQAALRLGVVLQRGTGHLQPFRRLAGLYMGGRQGSGRQYFSWIHETDFLRSIRWIMQQPAAGGTYNVTAPEAVPNREFMALLRQTLGVPLGLPAPSWLVHIGGAVIGTEPDLVLKGRHVVPGRLQREGFRFLYPRIEPALKHLLSPS